MANRLTPQNGSRLGTLPEMVIQNGRRYNHGLN